MVNKWITVGATVIAMSIANVASAEWQPDKPLRIIVPWGAGGSTDQLVRTLAGDLEGALNQKVIIVNQPGGAGAVGTKAAFDAPKDGYTWTGGASKDLGTYGVTGAIETHLEDWHLYLATVNFTLLSVNPDSKFKTVNDIATAMKSDPGSVTIATGGINSAGGAAAEALKMAVGGDYKMITYDGGNPAVLATVSHETEITTQLVAEQFEMLRAKKLIPLGAYTDGSVNLPGIGEIPSIKAALPNIQAGPVHFGIWIPKGVPREVVDTMNKIWDDKITNSKALADYALSKGLSVNVIRGNAAYNAAFPVVQMNAWQIHDGGKSKHSPDQISIPRQ